MDALPVSDKTGLTGTFYVVTAQAALQLCLAVLIIRARTYYSPRAQVLSEALTFSGMIVPPLLFAGLAAFVAFQAPLAQMRFGLDAVVTVVFMTLGLPASLGSYVMKASFEDRREYRADAAHPRILAAACIAVPACITAAVLALLPVVE